MPDKANDKSKVTGFRILPNAENPEELLKLKLIRPKKVAAGIAAVLSSVKHMRNELARFARDYQAQGIAVVGFGYVMVGAALLLRTDPTCAPGGWAVGGVFGIGHLATALVLWRGVEPEGEGDTSG